LSKMLVVCTEQCRARGGSCRAVASFTKKDCIHLVRDKVKVGLCSSQRFW